MGCCGLSGALPSAPLVPASECRGGAVIGGDVPGIRACLAELSDLGEAQWYSRCRLDLNGGDGCGGWGVGISGPAYSASDANVSPPGPVSVPDYPWRGLPTPAL